MDQARLRGANRRIEAEAINLGNEPPLSVDGGASSPVGRRRLSIQWFSGTILTGLCGAALMGGAVFASLDGETNFATAPERFAVALHASVNGPGDRLVGARKTDRLPPPSEPSVARQIMRVAVASRVHDREVVHMRPYVRLAGTLALAATDLSANIPPFNPQKLLTDGVANADETPTAEPDAEVSFVTCDFAPIAAKGKGGSPVCDINSLLPRIKQSTLLSLDEVAARVREVAFSAKTAMPKFAAADPTPTAGLKLSYAAEGDVDPYAGFAARVIPENVTLRSKTVVSPNDWNERVVVAKKGDSVASILRDLGATPDEIKALVGALGAKGREGGLKEGYKLRILLAAAGASHLRPMRVIIASDSAIEAAAALNDRGSYVAVDTKNIDTSVAETSDEASEDDGRGVRLYQSLYETGLANNVPLSVIQELVRIYSYDVDFQRKVQPGDTLDVLYADDESGEGRNEVRYVSLTLGGETKRYYHFQTTDDGAYDYYDETGKSAKKFLVRKPVATGVMRSGFGERNHPLLHYMKMHTGVDWAAPMGTPIFAAGNGSVDEIGVKGGYGKYVRLRHANGYQTAYGHMTAFARGLQVGSRVRQGQVIGFVGSTGLSTGAHVHFEILINDRFVDPMKIKLPRGRVLDGQALIQFEKDRQQLDGLMAHAPGRLASH